MFALLFGKQFNAIQYFPDFKNWICLFEIIEIIPALALVSKIHVPAVGVDVKNPIADETPITPVVFGDISQDPVSILNCIYSGAAGVRLTPLLIHFVLGRSYVRKSPFAGEEIFTSLNPASEAAPPDSFAAIKFVPLYLRI